MTASKTAITVSSLAFAMIFGGGLYLYMNLGAIAERVAEDLASRTLGVEVTMSKLDLSLQNRTAVVHNLLIGNPPGFPSRHAATVSEITMTLGDISRDLLIFEEIRAGKTNLYLDVAENGMSNMQAIQAGLQTLPLQGETRTAAPNIIIDKAVITDARLIPQVASGQDGETWQPFTAPPLSFSGLGRSESGITAQKAIAEIWSVIARESQQAAVRRGIMEGLLPEMIQDSGDFAPKQGEDGPEGAP